MEITKEAFDSIYPVFAKLAELNNESRNDYNWHIEPKWDYRKNEYVFGVTITYTSFNFEMKDYFCVFFNDSDDGKAQVGDFEEMISDIETFIARVKSVNK